MRTKTVYAISSSLDDYYYEQVWASAFSLKYYNPEAHVVVVADRESFDIIHGSFRKNSLAYIDELIPVDIDKSYTNMQKSRWLKTNLRSLVDGDYLFIDGDTLITGDLSEVDNLTCNIGMVLDYHVPFQQNWNYCREVKSALRIFGKDCSNVNKYFNSGVIYCKDNQMTREFYSLWHEKWKEGNQLGYSYDQLSLMLVCMNCPEVCQEISGIYNCQITVDLNYLYDAKIIHFFSSTATSFTPFKNRNTYLKIQKDHCVCDELKELILNCKRRFVGPVYIMTSSDHADKENALYKLYMALHRRRDKWYVRLLERASSYVVR